MALLMLSASSLANGIDFWPFSRLDYEAASKKATAEGKFLLVHFTSFYSSSNKRLVKDTLDKKRVREWLDKHTIAIQLNVDDNDARVSKFKIKATPTMVVFKNGKEFDRHVGYVNSIKFMRWAKLLENGKRQNGELLLRAEEALKSSDLDERFGIAKELAAVDLMELAGQHYLALWELCRHDPEWEHKRWTELLPEVVNFCSHHLGTHLRFIKYLEAPIGHKKSPYLPTYELWQEWTRTCSGFGERDYIIKWYQANRDENGYLYKAQAYSKPGVYMVSEVMLELEMAGFRKEAIGLVENPRTFGSALISAYRESLKETESIQGGLREAVRENFEADLTRGMGLLYGCLLATDKFFAANEISNDLLKALDDPQSRLMLVTFGIRATQTSHRYFWRLLKEAEAAGATAPAIRKALEQFDRDADEMVTH